MGESFMSDEWTRLAPHVVMDIPIENIPEDVIGVGVFISGKQVETYDFRRHCSRCRETMRAAWGDDCPICGQRMVARYVASDY